MVYLILIEHQLFTKDNLALCKKCLGHSKINIYKTEISSTMVNGKLLKPTNARVMLGA